MTDFFGPPVASKSRKSKRCFWCGELIHKGDDPVIDAPVLLAKIADNIMDFNQEWEGD